MRVAVLAALVLGLAGESGQAAVSWRTAVDRPAGYTVSVPRSWQVVPRSTAELDRLIARLRAEKRTALANQLAQIAAVRRATGTTFRFQAFMWPAPSGAVVPDVTVKTDPLRAGTTAAALPQIARQVAKVLASTSGATASTPVTRSLPAGRAMQVTGTTRITKTTRSRFSLYLLIRGRRLYTLAFRGPASPLELRIAERFRLL
mgnify:CR=1 FL=1